MESVNQTPEDKNGTENTKYPILTSIFNQSFLDEYNSKLNKFSILFICTLLFFLVPINVIDAFISNFYIFAMLMFIILIPFVYIVYIVSIWTFKLDSIDSVRKVQDFILFKYYFDFVGINGNFKYLEELEVLDYLNYQERQSIPYMLNNSEKYHKELTKLENMFKNKLYCDVHLVSEEIAKITEKREQDEKVKTWIKKVYKKNSSVLNKQNAQFQEILKLHNSSLEPNVNLFNFQIINTHDDVVKNIMDYLDNQKTNKNIMAYKDIKKIFEEQIIQKNNNLLKDLLDKVLN